jgi:hypothetical protein
MAGKPAVLSGPIRIADYLSTGLLARLCPPEAVDAALTSCNRQSIRRRDLPAHAVVYYVMALSLYRDVNCAETLRVITEGMEFLGDSAIRREVGKSGITGARKRLGWEVMARLASELAQPLADATCRQAFYRGMRVVSLDGSTLEVADEAANAEAFGYPGTQQGKTGYPQVRFTALLENGTHAMFGIAVGGYKDSEISLAQQTATHLKPGMLCLADRGLSGFPLWDAAQATGADLLWRIPKNRILPAERRLPDGSYLSSFVPAKATAQKLATPCRPLAVRVIEYTLPGVPDAEPVYRLITTLLDPEEAPAEELAMLYHARWSIETTFAEIKTTLKGADIVMRSKTPDLVRQEFWGLILAHHAIRKLMLEAALSRDEPPERLSFKQATRTVRRKLPVYGAISPGAPRIVVA